MTTITRIRTDYDARLHVEQDTDAEVNCFLVTLSPYISEPVLVYREGASVNELWADALAIVAHLKAQPWKLVAPLDHFRPFGVITARNVDDVRREPEYRMQKMLGSICGPEQIAGMAHISEVEAQTLHERGVQHLSRALDLLNGVPLPKGSFDTWPPARH